MVPPYPLLSEGTIVVASLLHPGGDMSFENGVEKGLARVLRIALVQERTGLSRSTIYERLNTKSARYDKTFPRPFKIGMSAIGWLESSIEQWIMSRIE
jgi:prophage regulatory protein